MTVAVEKIMTIEQLKIRQLTNQHVLDPADKMTVIRDLCGVQAQFFSNAMHSLKIRTTDYDEQTVAEGLVKNWSVRGTVHVFAESDLPLFIRCNNGEAYRKNEWGGYTFWNDGRRVWALTPERQKFFSHIIIDAVSERARTRDELKEICRAHGMDTEEEASMFEAWGGGIRELCERGFMHYVVHKTKACRGAVIDAGLELWTDENGGVWSFENCTCPRYTTPDEQGNVIMDYCYFVK